MAVAAIQNKSFSSSGGYGSISQTPRAVLTPDLINFDTKTRYHSVTKASPMAKQETVSWGIFQFVVTGLAVAAWALLGLIYFSVIGDISDLKKNSQTTNEKLTEARVELDKAIGAVEKQTAGTNARLDQLIADMRQRR